MFSHRCAMTAVMLGNALLASAPATSNAQEIRVDFNISAGAATDSIAEFGSQAKLNILAAGGSLKGITTNEVRGRYGVAEALDILLSGTGLAHRLNTNGSVFILSTTPGPRGDAGLESREETMTDARIPGQRTATCCAVSAALLLMGAPLSQAQEQANKNVQVAPTGSVDDDVRQVLVVGQRLSEQSAIERKKNAATAMDSLVADDIGSMPDTNVAEAVSRIAGVMLTRGDYGEGNSITVRGVANEETRVELDGLTTTSAGGSDLAGSGEGRASDLRELPSELISTIDVVKGYTPDMTEGSLGGSVIIKTRTGLDFKKRTILVRASGSYATINEKTTPGFNVLFGDKFLDGKLGVVVNLSKSRTDNQNHRVRHVAGTHGMQRTYDLDNSPEKTFALNPNALDLSQPASSAPLPYANGAGTTWAVNDGGARFAGHSAKDILAMSAAANSKQECFSAFPVSSPEFGRIASATDRAAAQRYRAQALKACLNQWNDYVPQGIRYEVGRQQEERWNGDIRLDFKVHKDLSVYGKFSKNNRDVHYTNDNLTMGAIATRTTSPVDTTTPMYTETPGSVATPYVRTVNSIGVQNGYHFYPGNYNLRDSTGGALVDGVGLNIAPGSLQFVDHQLTQFTLPASRFNNAVFNQESHTGTRTHQFGGNYRNGGFKVEFLWGVTRSESWRYRNTSGIAFDYGGATVRRNADGLYDFDFSNGVNPLEGQTDASLYTRLVPGTEPGQLRGASIPTIVADSMRIGEVKEAVRKFDATWSIGRYVPYFDRIKFGYNARTFESQSWSNNDTVIITPAQNGNPEIAVAGQKGTNYIQICENVPVAGGAATPCPYGFEQRNKLGPNGAGTYTVNQADFWKLVQAGLRPAETKFLNDANENINFPGWLQFDAASVYKVLGQAPVDLDCIKSCIGSDGKIHDRPISRIREGNRAAYLMTDFKFDRNPFTGRALPFDWELDGNFGYRIVQTDVVGTSRITYEAITVNPGWNRISNPDDVTSYKITRNQAIDDTLTFYMPALNLAFWPIRDTLVVRYNRTKTMARPPVAQMLNDGVTCTYDERNVLQGDQPGNVDFEDGDMPDSSCSGNVGNPGLQPKKNWNQNLSFEWYPDRDTSLSLALYHQKGIVGAGYRVPVENVRPFENTSVDVGGTALQDVQFRYNTYANDVPFNRRGVEVGGRTAFTSLPGVLRFSGISANYSTAKAERVGGNRVSFLSGAEVPPDREYAYTWNTALWYDDGRFNARIAMQVNGKAVQAWTAPESVPFPTTGAPLATIASAAFLPPNTIWKDPQRYIDAKFSYKFKNGLQLQFEARNLTNEITSYSMGDNGGAHRTMVDYAYNGRRFQANLVWNNL